MKRHMLKNIQWGTYLIWGSVAAVAYSIPAFFYIRNSMFRDSWLLYVGNFLFLLVLAAFVITFNRKRRDNASTGAMVLTGHIVTVIGVVLSVVLALIMLSVMNSNGMFGGGRPQEVLEDTPANGGANGRSNGLILFLIASAIIGNVSAGSFISIILPYTTKGDQTKEKVPPRQARA